MYLAIANTCVQNGDDLDHCIHVGCDSLILQLQYNVYQIQLCLTIIYFLLIPILNVRHYI
jgi:hypothetical protein